VNSFQHVHNYSINIITPLVSTPGISKSQHFANYRHKGACSDNANSSKDGMSWGVLWSSREIQKAGGGEWGKISRMHQEQMNRKPVT